MEAGVKGRGVRVPFNPKVLNDYFGIPNDEESNDDFPVEN